jgi:hypothetical protein
MYRVLAQLGDGEFMFVASRDELIEAIQLIEGLNAYWPKEYVVRDSQGNDVDLTRYMRTERERGAPSSFSC